MSPPEPSRLRSSSDDAGRREMTMRLVDVQADNLRLAAENRQLRQQLEDVRLSTAAIVAACGGEVEVEDRYVTGAPRHPVIHVRRDLGDRAVRFAVDLGEWSPT